MVKDTMASQLQWMPDKPNLYNSCITAVATHHFVDVRYLHCREEINILPPIVQIDIYYKAFQIGKRCLVEFELRDLDVFCKLVECGSRRHLLHHMFQALMDRGLAINRDLPKAYLLQSEAAGTNHVVLDKLINMGFVLSSFLCEAGWYEECEGVLEAGLSLAQVIDEPKYWHKALECCTRLLRVRVSFYKFQEADSTIVQAKFYSQRLRNTSRPLNLAVLYAAYSSMHLGRSEYDMSYELCVSALNELSEQLPAPAVIDVLIQIGKVCVIKRRFKQAELALQQAVCRAREYYGSKHVKYSDALLEYSHYLLNIGCVSFAVQSYQKVVDIRMSVFGGKNLHVAIAHQNLAFATCVHGYSTGKFKFSDAKEHASRAMTILNTILPAEHMLLASCRRVKAQILEEIAIDCNIAEQERRLLGEALELTLAALTQCRRMFGDDNVQTAKHYNYLGGLYQNMEKYQDAEEMHLKAIRIKSRLLNRDDHEVVISLRHLASLYHYDLHRYDEAERLYLRVIAIGKHLEGEKYSGLHDAYCGLHWLYSKKGDVASAERYATLLQECMRLRAAEVKRDRERITRLMVDERVRAVPDLREHFLVLHREYDARQAAAQDGATEAPAGQDEQPHRTTAS